MVKEVECDGCGEPVRFKHRRRINGHYYCKRCARKIRDNHRKETIEGSDEKEEIERLGRKQHAEYSVKSNERKKEERRVKRVERKNQTPPKPQGAKKTIVDRDNFFITFEEKKIWYKLLLRKGLDEEDAKERVNNLVRSQSELRKRMIKQNKSATEIKQRMSEMIEELWSY